LEFLTGLLSSIIRPIIQDELRELKAWAFEQSVKVQKFKEYDKEALKNIEAMEKASTTEEVKAHARRIFNDRAKLDL